MGAGHSLCARISDNRLLILHSRNHTTQVITRRRTGTVGHANIEVDISATVRWTLEFANHYPMLEITMNVGIKVATCFLLICPFGLTADEDTNHHPFNGVWYPNTAVNEALGVSPKRRWPTGFEIKLGTTDGVDVVGSKEDIETLLIVTAQHKGAILARGTFAFIGADGTRAETCDCVLTGRDGCTFLSVPAPHQAPVFAKVILIEGKDRSGDIVFFSWPPGTGSEISAGIRTTVGFSRQERRKK